MSSTTKPSADSPALPTDADPRLAAVLERIEQDRDAAIGRLMDLLRIPSISTDPAYAGDCRKAAEWCAQRLRDAGFDGTVHDTIGHPMVTGTIEGPAGAPHVLFYGHYDVQPPDPLEEWRSAPFEPVIEDHGGPNGPQITARGAADDKGQLLTFIEAMAAWREVHGELPIRATVLLEGEEESHSPSLVPFLEAHKDMLRADTCIVCDTGMWDADTPAITYMLRGMAYVEVTLRGPSHDLHSGMYGGSARNPNQVLARMLGELHDDDGRVTIPGFYDDVRDLTAEERAAWEALGFDEAAFLGGCGLKQAAGEAGRGALERLWARPTAEINGMWGGYIGEGAKTVIPAKAQAKVSCRLVADQDPRKIMAGIRTFFESRCPPDFSVSIKEFGAEPAVRVPTESKWLEAALAGLTDAWGAKARLIGCGGSIPVVGLFRQILGVDSLLVGFGLDDDRVHSPNEKYDVRCFVNGMRSHAAIIARLAAAAKG